jgi:hypothetical protein
MIINSIVCHIVNFVLNATHVKLEYWQISNDKTFQIRQSNSHKLVQITELLLTLKHCDESTTSTGTPSQQGYSGLAYLKIDNESCNKDTNALNKVTHNMNECGLDIDVVSMIALDLD